MTAGWDFDKSDNMKKTEYTKFPEGVTKIRVVDAIPVTRWTHWINAQKRSVNCPGKGCPICEIRHQQKANKEPYTHAMGRRVSMQVLNRNTGKLEMMEQGVTFFQDLRDLMAILDEKGKSLLDVDISVRRRGTGKDGTSYRLDIDDEYPLSDIDKKLMEDMVVLEEFYVPHEPAKILRVLNGEEFDKVMYGDDDATEFDDEDVVLK